MSNKKKNEKIVGMVKEAQNNLEKVELDIKPPKVEPLVPPAPVELPPIPKMVLGPDMIDKKERDFLMNETQKEKECFNHLRFPSEIHMIGSIQYDVSALLVAGGVFIGYALSQVMR